jgi:hypothetical protein
MSSVIWFRKGGIPIEQQTSTSARLHRYQLTASEFAFLAAICETCSDGSAVWGSVSKLNTPPDRSPHPRLLRPANRETSQGLSRKDSTGDG